MPQWTAKKDTTSRPLEQYTVWPKYSFYWRLLAAWQRVPGGNDMYLLKGTRGCVKAMKETERDFQQGTQQDIISYTKRAHFSVTRIIHTFLVACEALWRGFRWKRMHQKYSKQTVCNGMSFLLAVHYHLQWQQIEQIVIQSLSQTVFSTVPTASAPGPPSHKTWQRTFHGATGLSEYSEQNALDGYTAHRHLTTLLRQGLENALTWQGLPVGSENSWSSGTWGGNTGASGNFPDLSMSNSACSSRIFFFSRMQLGQKDVVGISWELPCAEASDSSVGLSAWRDRGSSSSSSRMLISLAEMKEELWGTFHSLSLWFLLRLREPCCRALPHCSKMSSAWYLDALLRESGVLVANWFSSNLADSKEASRTSLKMRSIFFFFVWGWDSPSSQLRL